MRKRGILRRIDEHMALGNEHMARGNELMAGIKEHMARGNDLSVSANDVMEANRQAFQDLRTTLRQINLRNERFMTEHSQTIVEQTRSLVEMRAEMRAEMRESRRQFVDEMQAQRRALFAILDRFENGGATGTA